MDKYTKALKKIFEDETPAQPTTRTRTEIEADIQAISDQLKGPLSNVERLCLVEDRQMLRKQLAALPTP